MSQFKKDDYIVVLKTRLNMIAFPLNYVYKQREDYKYLRPYLDKNDSRTNGLLSSVYNSEFCRYATKNEIEAYDKAGKPVSIIDIPTYDINDILNQLDIIEEKWKE